MIIDRLTKSAHSMAVHDFWEVDKFAQIYVSEVVRLLVYLKALSHIGTQGFRLVSRRLYGKPLA